LKTSGSRSVGIVRSWTQATEFCICFINTFYTYFETVFVCPLATLFAVCVGTVDGWTSPALPFLQDCQLPQGHNSSNCSFHHVITDDEASWIGSLAPLGALIGAIPAGYLANILGRRQLLLILTVPLFLGWMTIIIAQDSVCRLF
jgi:SP family facilitated glucose transporter-like MFS transporter 8